MSLLDLRDRPIASLAEQVEEMWAKRQGAGLLVVSRRPAGPPREAQLSQGPTDGGRRRWTSELKFARPLHLASAPLYELVLWVDKELDLSLPAEDIEEQRALLEGYRLLFEAPQAWEEYAAMLRRHIGRQEQELYPGLLERAPLQRATRELSYEHQGLEKGCERLGEALRGAKLEKRQRDRLDLDFFHLLEHHIERERDALIPAWIFLTSRG